MRRRAGLRAARSSVAGLALVACAAAPRPLTVSTTRATPLVPLDPPLELPRAAPSSSATTGLVVLQAPQDPRVALDTVERFFRAVTAESTFALAAVLDTGARSRQRPGDRPDQAAILWRRRFDALDYTPLASEVFHLKSQVEVVTGRDVPRAAGAAPLPTLPRGEEVLVRAPLFGRGVGRLFGKEIVFLLRPSARSGGGYTIAELYEDFRLP